MPVHGCACVNARYLLAAIPHGLLCPLLRACVHGQSDEPLDARCLPAVSQPNQLFYFALPPPGPAASCSSAAAVGDPVNPHRSLRFGSSGPTLRVAHVNVLPALFLPTEARSSSLLPQPQRA
eukprot:scaffold101297_cov33-Tisochrysis_lutea.AAC.1